MRLPFPLLFALAMTLAASGTASAQDPRFALAVKGGASAENSEDNLHGTSPALGITGSVAFAHGWRGEIEFWLPGYIEDARGDPKHRDILFSVSAVKTFDAGRVRPFLAAGVSFARVQDWFSFCTANRPMEPGGPDRPVIVSCDEPDLISTRRERNDGTDAYLLGGGGMEWPLTRHLGLVADVRLCLAPVSAIIRPAAGLVFTF